MSCHCVVSDCILGTDRFFTKFSKKYLKRYRRRGLAKEQKYLIEGITMTDIAGKSILDIGCGIGGIHLEMLKHGASMAVGVEISQGMIEAAKQLSKEMGFDSKTRHLHGDFLEMDENIPRADITILDKVICCYENVDELITKSAQKTQSIYGLSFPRPHWMIKFIFNLPILAGKILRWKFRPYWHDWIAVLAMIQKLGFTQRYNRNTFLWSVYIFEKG